MRVSELTAVKMHDIDDHLGIVLVMGKGRKERYVPFGSFAQSALDAYRENSRLNLMKQKEHDMLFVNLRGDPLTDRGVRHILKHDDGTRITSLENLSTYDSPFFCNPPFGRGRRHENRSGTTWTQSLIFNASVYTYNKRAFTENIYEYASASIGG